MKRLLPFYLALSSCFVYAAMANDSYPKPSFDCDKARSAYERAVCLDLDLAKLDRQMAQAYSTKRATLSAEARKELLQTQRAYLKQIQTCQDNRDCIARNLTNRIHEIQNFMPNRNESQYSESNYEYTPQAKPKRSQTATISINPQAKPSFDCTKATSVYEQVVCSDTNLAALDKKMAELYAAKRTKLNNAGKARLQKAQLTFLQKVNECEGDKGCIEQNLISRINKIRQLQSQDSMLEHVVQFKNQYGQCLGGEDGVCHVSLIGIGEGACLTCSSGIEGSFAYIDNLKLAIYYNQDLNTLVAQRMEKFEARQNRIYAQSYEEGGFGSGETGFTSSVKVIGYDDDFIHFAYEVEACGAYCLNESGSAYFDIALREIVGLDSEALLAKLINDEMCGKGKSPKAQISKEHCQISLQKAQDYFFSHEFRSRYGRNYVYIHAIGAWIDVRNVRVVGGQILGDVVYDNDEVRSILTGVMRQEFCNGGADSALCVRGQEAQECYFEDSDGWGVCNLWGKEVRFGTDALLIDFRFPQVLRSQDTTIKIPYNRLQPYAKGILQEIIATQKTR